MPPFISVFLFVLPYFHTPTHTCNRMTLHVLCWWCTNELQTYTHTHKHGNETHYVNVEGKLKERKNWTKGIKSNKLDNLVKLKCNFMKWGVSFFIINGFDVVLFMFVLVFWWLICFCVCVQGAFFSCIFLSKNFHSTTSITRVKILFLCSPFEVHFPFYQ